MTLDALPPSLELFDTGTAAGWGVRAKHDLVFRKEARDTDNFLGYYKGSLLRGQELEAKYQKTGGEARYAIKIADTDWYIDAAHNVPENWARFINDPGVAGGGNVEFVADVANLAVMVVLRRTVSAGEQLLAEYNPHGVPATEGGFLFENDAVLDLTSKPPPGKKFRN